jgi:hypothetical protein
MDEHFADLFARYEQLAPRHSVQVVRVEAPVQAGLDLSLPQPAALGS